MSAFTVELNSDAEADLLAIADIRTRKAVSVGLLRLGRGTAGAPTVTCAGSASYPSPPT